jgi:hypothetical protein
MLMQLKALRLSGIQSHTSYSFGYNGQLVQTPSRETEYMLTCYYGLAQRAISGKELIVIKKKEI